MILKLQSKITFKSTFAEFFFLNLHDLNTDLNYFSTKLLTLNSVLNKINSVVYLACVYFIKIILKLQSKTTFKSTFVEFFFTQTLTTGQYLDFLFIYMKYTGKLETCEYFCPLSVYISQVQTNTKNIFTDQKQMFMLFLQYTIDPSMILT